MKVLVTGASGQVGSAVLKLFSEKSNVELTGLNHNELDISNRNDVCNLVSAISPDVVINAAAMTNVDLCESEQEKAYAINSLGVRNLVNSVKDLKSQLIHLSTDFVFDGQSNLPYTEFDTANPLSIYAKSKLGGDQEALRYENSTVLRVAWVFGAQRNDFFNWVINGVRSGEIKSLIGDQISTPTYSHDIASVVGYCVVNRLLGLVNVANEGETTKLEMGKKACDFLGIDHSLSSIDAQSLNRPAPRPHYSALSTATLKNQTSIEMRSWEDAMKEHLKTIGV